MGRFWGHRFRRTTLLTLSYAGFLCGVGLAGLGYTVALEWTGLFGALLPVFRRRTMATLCLVVLTGLGLGMWRGSVFERKLGAYQPLYGQKITVSATATDDAVYGKHSQITFDAGNVRLEDGASLPGKMSLSGFGMNAVYRGDEVRAAGRLYPGYGAHQAGMSYAKLQLIASHPSLTAQIYRRFAAGMQSALPEPLAPFAMGLLIGQRATLPDGVKQDLLMVGLTHIIAVSGYNLTIMLRASRGVLGSSSKRLATLLSLGLIGVFLLLAGSSASIVRAAIVSVLSITAAYYGRSFKPLNLIMLAAAFTAWLNPFYVWTDPGWYLSFLAFYGVMVLAPAVSLYLRPRWRRSLVAMVALESICAETMTLPYILHVFGQMSFIGLPANVLVVTLVPLAMLLGLVAGLAGMVAGPFAGWFAWPARLLLNYMLAVSGSLAGLPHVFAENIGVGLGQMLALYAAIVFAGITLQFKTTRKSAKITDITRISKEVEDRHVRSLQMVNN